MSYYLKIGVRTGGSGHPVVDTITYTAYGWKLGTLTVTKQLTARDTATFTITSQSYIPDRGSPVLIGSDDLGDFFGGVIDTVQATEDPASGYVDSVCTCVSWDAIMTRRLIAPRVYNGKSLQFIAQDIIDSLWDDGLHYGGGSIVTGPTFPSIAFDYMTAYKALDYLCQQASDSTNTYTWDILPDKTVRVYLQTTHSAPWDGSTDLLYTVAKTVTGQKLANTVTLRLSKSIADAVSESYHGDGSTTRFNTVNPIAAEPVVTLNGATQTVGVDGVDTGKDWYWTLGSQTLTQDSGGTVLTVGDTIEITYQGYVTRTAYYENSSSIAAVKSVEGGSGFYELFQDISTPMTQADGDALAQSLAEHYGNVSVSIAASTLRAGLVPGDSYSLTLSALGANATFLIESVVLSDANLLIDQPEWSLKMSTGAIVGDWLSWIAGIAGNSAGGTGSVAGLPVSSPPGDTSRTITSSDSELASDNLVLCDTSGISGTTTTLAAAMTDTTSTSFQVSSGVGIFDGTYLKIGTEIIGPVSGGGGAGITTITGARGALGSTAATHLNGATVNIPGALAFTLLAISSIPNKTLIVRKTTSDLNYVKIIAAGGDTFHGGGTVYVLPSNQSNEGTVTLRAPGSGTEWISISGSGATGPAGPPGPAGVGTPAPNVTATASVYYDDNGRWGLTGTITLPISDPDYSHLVRIDVRAINPSGNGAVIATFTGWGGSTISYTASVDLLPAAAQTWSVEFDCENEQGAVSTSPYTVSGLSVAAAPSVASVTAAELANSVYPDANDGLHMAVRVNASLTAPHFPVRVRVWIDYDDGNGWTLQPDQFADGASPSWTFGAPEQQTGVTIPGTIWVPTDPAKTSWKVAAEANSHDQQPSGAAVTNNFTVTSAQACSATDLSSLECLVNPATGDQFVYSRDAVGVYRWIPYEIHYYQPNINALGHISDVIDPYFKSNFFTAQLGYEPHGSCTVTGGANVSAVAGITLSADDAGNEAHIGGQLTTIATVNVGAQTCTLNPPVSNGSGLTCAIWRPAPVNATNGTDGQSDALASVQGYLGRKFTDGPAPSALGMQEVHWTGDPRWTISPLTNLDGTTNLYRSTRILAYAVSRLGDNESGGTSTITRQTSWPANWDGSTDYTILTPSVQQAALDLSQTNPTTSFSGTSPITGGGGTPLDIAVTGALTKIAKQIAVAAGGITNTYLANAAVMANNMAAAAITYANAALDANSVVDSNIASASIGKLIAGTVVFSGNVSFARGNGAAVLTMDNTGLYLFSNCTASGSGVTPGTPGSPTYTASGLTSSPYVGVTASQIGVFSSSTGPSVTVTGSGINLWSVNGNTSFPYANLTSTAWQIHNGNFTFQVSASQLQFAYASGPSATLNAISLKLLYAAGSYSAVLQSTGLTLYSVDGNTGSPYVSIASTGVTVSQGILTLNLNGITTTIGNAFDSGAGIYAGMNVTDNSTGFYSIIGSRSIVLRSSAGAMVAMGVGAGTTYGVLSVRNTAPNTPSVVIDGNLGFTVSDPLNGWTNQNGVTRSVSYAKPGGGSGTLVFVLGVCVSAT